jgi:3-oxoadipate enol-lactonase
VVTFDNRGVGKSDKPPGPYSAQMLADDTIGLLEALGIQRAAVMGHSMGGFIAQALVLSRPDLVSKLILSATNFGGPNHIPVTQEALAFLMDQSGDPAKRVKRGVLIACAPGFSDRQPDMIEKWITYRLENPVLPEPNQAQMAIGLALMSQEAAFEHKLKNVSAPTLILFGEHDKVVPPGNAELLAKAIPNSTVHILPNAGHHLELEVPDEAVATIVGFLKG